MDLKETYDLIAEDWHEDHQRDNWWVEGTSEFMSRLPDGAHVLDVGCGGGFKSRFLLENGFVVSGIDFSSSMIDICKREVSEGSFQVLDMREVDSLSATFDGVFLQASLLHIPREEASVVVKKCDSVLRNGGYLYIAVKAKRDNGVEEHVKQESDYGYEYERFFSYFSQEEIESFMVGAGLEVVYSEVHPTSGSDWVQVIARK